MVILAASKGNAGAAPPSSKSTASASAAPLLDRIDLHVEVPTIEYKGLASKDAAEPSAAIRARVEAARGIQRERFKSERHAFTNAAMTPRLIRSTATSTRQAQVTLNMR